MLFEHIGWWECIFFVCFVFLAEVDEESYFGLSSDVALLKNQPDCQQEEMLSVELKGWKRGYKSAIQP